MLLFDYTHINFAKIGKNFDILAVYLKKEGQFFANT